MKCCITLPRNLTLLPYGVISPCKVPLTSPALSSLPLHSGLTGSALPLKCAGLAPAWDTVHRWVPVLGTLLTSPSSPASRRHTITLSSLSCCLIGSLSAFCLFVVLAFYFCPLLEGELQETKDPPGSRSPIPAHPAKAAFWPFTWLVWALHACVVSFSRCRRITPAWRFSREWDGVTVRKDVQSVK